MTVFRYVERVGADAYGEPEPVLFEGRKFPGPQDLARVLRGLYGDYLTMPPESERKVHGSVAYWL